jgi:putative transposase
VSAPPNIAPSEIMRRIKGRSSRKLFEIFPELKKRYWRELWSGNITGQEPVSVFSKR